jgi:chromosome segregation ATPase
MASAPSEDRESSLWALIESRDRAFARAHAAFQSVTHEAREKDDEIHRLTVSAREKDGEIERLTTWARELEIAPREKDAEIQRLVSVLAERERSLAEKESEIHNLTGEAQARLAVIQRLEASREYKLGVVALHPWRTLKEKR